MLEIRLYQIMHRRNARHASACLFKQCSGRLRDRAGTGFLQYGSEKSKGSESFEAAAYTDPLGATTAYTYDGAGRPLSRRDGAGRTLAYDYDGAGRL
ncbi:hypothetical protein GO611_23885, partial [Azoarcus communis SWub3 = DSM 12120]|nr:hypothetical protein [Parazoarcus communis SWub3 = DSM 12120]